MGRGRRLRISGGGDMRLLRRRLKKASLFVHDGFG